jgi:hypothetical protein
MERFFKTKLREYFNSAEIIESTTEQDMNERWDFQVNLKFDVKGLKKIRRSDTKTDENFHYIELKNVNGKNGWLYGEATHFSFETNDYWVIIEKNKLQNFIKQKCKDKIKCAVPTLYQLYTRKNRKDVIVLVKTIDLMAIADFIISKGEKKC